MRLFVYLTLVVITTFCLYTSGHTQTQHKNWFIDFKDRLEPASEPANLLAGMQPPGSEQEQVHVLAEYFRTQAFVKPAWVIRIPDVRDPSYDTSLADSAVNNLITSMYGREQFGNKLPWFDKDKKVKTLARFPHFDYLVPAYFHAGNEDYARVMVRHIEDFMENAPISLAADVNIQTEYTINPWNWVLQHWRIMRWIDALALLKDSRSLEDQTYLKILLHLWQEVDWLAPRMILGLHNGTLGNLRAVLYTALNFPEAVHATYWKNEALGLFKSFIGMYFYPGEVSVELTLGYSSAVLAQCLKIYEALPASNLKKDIGTALEALVDGHVGLMKPDRSLPRYGDHGNFDVRSDLLEKAGQLFDRADLLWLATGGPGHHPPRYLSFPARSRPYYLSGYYAMRDSWGRDAQYLSMDAGPFGTNHQHADKLSITVSADGANFIVDPGTSIYNSTEPVPRYDLRFGFLHNSITVDGVDQNAGWDQHYQFDVLDNRWVTNSLYDFIEGSYDYRSSGLDIVHRRSIFYKRGEYWLLLDALQGDSSHDIESSFQFMFDIDLQRTADDIVARAANGSALHIVSAPDNLSHEVAIGDSASIRTRFPVRYPNIDHIPGGRGWVGVFGNYSPYDPNHSYAAPAIIFSGKVNLPHYSVRVLSPSKDKKARLLTVSWLERERDHIRLEIEHLSAARPTADIFDMKTNPEISIRKKPEDENGFWLRFVDGLLTQIAFLNENNIEFTSGSSQVRLRFSEPAEGFLIDNENGWRLYIDTYIEKPITLLEFRNGTPGTQELYLSEGESNLGLVEATGEAASMLIPGRVYTLTPVSDNLKNE